MANRTRTEMTARRPLVTARKVKVEGEEKEEEEILTVTFPGATRPNTHWALVVVRRALALWCVWFLLPSPPFPSPDSLTLVLLPWFTSNEGVCSTHHVLPPHPTCLLHLTLFLNCKLNSVVNTHPVRNNHYIFQTLRVLYNFLSLVT